MMKSKKTGKPLTRLQPAAKREAAAAISRTWGSLSQTAARLARKLDSGAGVVARRK